MGFMITSTFSSKNYDVWKNTALNPQTFAALKTKAQLEYLCLLAHLAPSSHNTQPWRFFIDEQNQSIIIYLDRKFILPASDVDGRQALVSAGSALENLIYGANYLGFECGTELLTTDNNKVKPFSASEPKLTPLVKIKFKKIKPDINLEKNYQAIFNRKVVRTEYDPQKLIPENILQSIQNFADGETIKLHIITDNARRLGIAEFQAQADGFVINSSKFSKELGDWLLPNDTESFVGMPGIGFGLPDDQALRMHHGLLGKAPLQPEDGLKFAAAGKIGLEKSPAIIVITTKKDDIENWIAAGRLFEKIFLKLTASGIQLAMHAGITEVALIKKIFSMTLGTTRHVTVLFRIGYAKKESDVNRPHTPRLPLTEVIITDKPSP